MWGANIIFGDFTSSCKKYRNLCFAILFKRPFLYVTRKRTPKNIEKLRRARPGAYPIRKKDN